VGLTNVLCLLPVGAGNEVSRLWARLARQQHNIAQLSWAASPGSEGFVADPWPFICQLVSHVAFGQ
jgi:hypothetical protein